MPGQKTLFIFLTISLLSMALPLPAMSAETTGEEHSPESLAIFLQDTYKSLTSLTFAFDQVTRTGTRERRGRGEAVFYRFRPPAEDGPENSISATQSVMRWDYIEPDPQIIVSDGETLSIYTEKDKQLIRTPAKELESDITYAFFSGSRDLLDDFAAQDAEADYLFSSGTDLQSLLLVPREPHNQIRDVRVWFDDKGIIHHLVITDHFDSLTELNFDNIRVNTLPPGNREALEEIITFTIPPGTEIISR
ncbi:MAG: outer membrane lipoprotein carrier protein LolA [Desulfobulbaceae bacterium]|nr:outer membrane lipoprotein carrier protein LolA [Desulfobulbaceae bacterium]